MKKDQKFKHGDLVRVVSDLGESMSHFHGAGEEAIVEASYAEQYGGSDTESYTLNFKSHGRISWYYESQLTLIEPNRTDLLATWREELRQRHEQRSDPAWIFAHAEEAMNSSSAITALARDLGINDLWPSGEGFEWQVNASQVLRLAAPYLVKGDRDGWNAFATKVKEARK